jgi:four helix bundle protein
MAHPPVSIAVSFRRTGKETAMETNSRTESTSRFPFQDLDVYRAARQLATLVHRAAIRDAELRDQATRAAKSSFLNLAEGLPDDRPAMRRKYFAHADGSLHETVAAVDLASAIGALDERRAGEILAVAARMRGMLRGLLRVSVSS